jgi:hypothetical protein
MLHNATVSARMNLEVWAMSILHVRNVPETLYERLRRRAEAQRRSLSTGVR